MRGFITVDRQTDYLLPPSVDEWLPENHLARFIVEVIDRLDLTELTRTYGGRGSAAHHPPRPRHAGPLPRRFGAQFEQLFVQVLMLAREMGMLKLGKISVDGSKIKANASKHRALSWGHLQKIEKQLQQEVQQLMAMAESADRKNVPDGMEVPKEIALRQERLAVLDEAKRKLEARARERDLAAQAEYDGKLAKRQARRDAGKKPGGKEMRGHAHQMGLHTFRIAGDGLHVYPRLLPELGLEQRAEGGAADIERVPVGVPDLDTLLHGGLPKGHAVMVVGPSGSGKTILGTAFLAQGVALGERGVIACFEKGPSRLRNAALDRLVAAGQVSMFSNRSLDLSVEEILDDLVSEVRRTGATRVVIDSLSEAGLYLAPEFRLDFREAIFRILAGLAATGATVMVTMGLEDRFTDLRFSQADSSFLADAIIAMRYVEIEGHLSKVISVIKVRGSGHDKDLRRYEITENGLQIDPTVMRFDGMLSGRPVASGERG